MTRNRSTRSARASSPAEASWALQDAKARFGELVRRARASGPQVVTVHGRAEVVVVAVEEFRRLTGEPSGQALVDALSASPLSDLDLEREPLRAPVRRVDL